MLRRSVLAYAGALALAGFTLAPVFAQSEGADLPAADAVLFESLEQVEALAASGPAILYFHADWCPTCQATMTSFQARWDEVQPGITLVIVDYDKEVDLRTQFGVSYQNTYVQVGADGERLQIWNGGGIRALNERPIFDV